MRLNMWQIANRLYVLEPELHLKGNRPCDIRGVRRYAADGYVQVSKDREGIVCRYEDEYFILQDMTLEEAFGLVQDVFDFYDTWFENLYHYATHMDFDSVVKSCELIFKNPLMILDSNYKVIAMSQNYGPDDVDAEWKYLYEHGFSSVKAVQFLNERRQLNRSDYLDDKPKVHQQILEKHGCVNMSLKIISGNTICGSLVIMQKEREFNDGDKTILTILSDILSPYMSKLNFNSVYEWGSSVFSKLLMRADYDMDALHMQLQYYKWNENDSYHLLLMGYRMPEANDMLIRLLRSSVLQILPFAVVEIIEKQVVVIVNEKDIHIQRRIESLKEIADRNRLYILKSLSFEKITYLSYAYEQIMSMEKFTDIQKAELFYSFEKVAAKYLLMAEKKEQKLYAVHPQIRKAWQRNTSKTREELETLCVYLENNRSIADTARELFLARNTLVYRIRKVIEELQLDLEEKETRWYILLSLKILFIQGIGGDRVGRG